MTTTNHHTAGGGIKRNFETIPVMNAKAGDTIIDDQGKQVTIKKIYGNGGLFVGKGNLLRLQDTEHNRRHYKACIVVRKLIDCERS